MRVTVSPGRRKEDACPLSPTHLSPEQNCGLRWAHAHGGRSDAAGKGLDEAADDY